ncbi:MAG: ThiF family adenylyltransferase [Planctomycetaceae bacterium]
MLRRLRPFPLAEQAEAMTREYINLPGGSIDADALDIPRARQIASAITGGRLDFVRLVECCKIAGASIEILVIEVDVERPQVVVNPIRRVERIAVLLSADDDSYPEVLAVRKGFPVVPHMNITVDENTRSLCLYDQSWDEVKSRWTAPAFIERIRSWLADTAIGSLHREDQPLEQVLAGSGYSLVIPSSAIKSGGEAATRLDVILIPSDEHRGTLIAIPKSENGRRKKLQFTASMFFAGSRQHGIIHRAPRTLEELCEFVRTETFDLLTELRKRVMGWKDDGCLDVSLIVVIAFPLQRGDIATIEVIDTWAFLTTETVYEVGKRIGVWDKNDGKIGLFVPPIESLKGADVTLEVLRPHFSFSRSAAARASGVNIVDAKTVAVGVGAIGSQIVLNLVRGGFGRWTVIDNDELLPHNLARHALLSDGIGWPKAVVLAATINSFFEDEPPTVAISANVLRCSNAKEKLDTAFAESDLILDLSASVPVSRHLARDVQSAARRISLFLNPRGSDLVCISEDAQRTMHLDELEAQYYRAVIRDPALAGHLAVNEARTRYARSCRDISFSIPTHLVSMHSAIAAQAVRQL